MTKLEILKETREFYEVDPVGRRALASARENASCTLGACLYETAASRRGAADSFKTLG